MKLSRFPATSNGRGRRDGSTAAASLPKQVGASCYAPSFAYILRNNTADLVVDKASSGQALMHIGCTGRRMVYAATRLGINVGLASTVTQDFPPCNIGGQDTAQETHRPCPFPTSWV